MSADLQQAEGAVKAARQLEADATSRADAAIAIARESVLQAEKAREDAERAYEAIYEREEAALRMKRARVFPWQADEPVLSIEASNAA